MAFDVFISFKNTDGKGGLTQDRMIAERLHSELKREGLEVFFSERDLDNAVFIREINNALEEARMLILVGTTPAHVRSKWVEAEWSSFLAMINSGRKPDGQMITVLQGMTTNDLPPMISSLQSFDALDIDGVVRFVFKALGRVSLSEAAEYEKKQQEEALRRAEEERLRAIAAQMEAERDARKAAEDAANERKARKEAEKASHKAKKSVRWIVAAAALVVVAAVAVVLGISYNTPRSVVVDGVEYSMHKGQATVVDCDEGKSGAFVIPSRIKGNRVTTIGDYAFYNCKRLTQITIPDSVITIEYGVFYDCNRLTEITIPDSVTSIGDNPFEYCSSLTSITVDAGNEFYHSIDGVLFNADNLLIAYPAGKMNEKYDIPDSVATIGNAAFYWCDSLTEITIPDSVATIGDSAFYGCTSLTEITIPDSVTTIGDFAFYRCYSLTEITIPDSVTAIGNYAFSECDSLTEITIPDSVTAIGDSAFFYCDSLTEITIPDSVITIANAVFSGCRNLTEITIPDSVTIIGDSAFRYCYSLTEITIPNSVTTIGDYAFDGCSSLTNITIPDSVTTIGDSAFYCCWELTEITIPESVTTIGDFAFYTAKPITIKAPHDPSYYNYTPTENETWTTP